MHSWEPAVSEKVPGAQRAHAREEVAPVAKEKVPAGQGTQGEPEKGPYVPAPHITH